MTPNEGPRGDVVKEACSLMWDLKSFSTLKGPLFPKKFSNNVHVPRRTGTRLRR